MTNITVNDKDINELVEDNINKIIIYSYKPHIDMFFSNKKL